MTEARAAADLAARHHEGLFRWALALSGRDGQEAMEIVQQTYVEVLEGRADVSSARDPRAFLFGVARRVAASRRRRRSIWGRVLRLEISRTPEPGGAGDPESEASAGERIDRVRRALGEISGRQAEVTALVFGEGLTVEEAAGVMGISVGSARTHYHRAKQRLARLLEGIDDVGGR